MNALWKTWDKISRAGSILGAIVTLMIMLIVVIDVAGRILFESPLTGTTEIVGNSVVGIVFLQLAWSVKENRHIRATFLVDRLPKFAIAMNIFANIVGILLFMAIIVANWPIMIHSISVREFEGAAGVFKFPVYIMRVLLVVGSVLTVVQHIEALYFLIAELVTGKKKSDGEI